jgi:imidazolonepropionase-like amidohydrolase
MRRGARAQTRVGLAILCVVGSACGTSDGGVTAFTGARVFDGTGAQAVDDLVMVVRDGRFEQLGPRSTVTIPRGARHVDLSGKFVIPGLINTHGHVGDTRGLDAGHYSGENVLRQLRLYARYGVTTVNSLGGDEAVAVAMRNEQDSDSLDRARIYVAGTVVSGATPEEAVAVVDENVAMGVDVIKIRVDDNLGTTEKMTPDIYRAVIERAHAHQKPVAAHLYYLDDAKDLLRAGVDFVAHSIRDRPVDDEIIQLLRDRGVCYTPTLTRELSTFVYESEPDFFSDDFFLAEVEPELVEQLRDPDRQASVRANRAAQIYKRALTVAMANLRPLVDGGVTIALGTDTGPPGRFQGYFEHLEMQLMAEAGLSPEEILQAATGDAARCLGHPDIGTIAPGHWADFVVLDRDPLVDIKNTETIASVWIAGNEVPRQVSH